MNRLFLVSWILFNCLFATVARAQHDNLQVVKGVADEYFLDSIAAERFLKQGGISIDSLVIDSAMYFYRKALNLGNKLDNKLVQAKAQNGIGYLYSIYLSQLDSAEIYLRNAYQLAKENNFPRRTAHCLYDLCDVLRNLGQNKEASAVLIEAATINDSLGLDSINAGVYYKMAGVFIDLDNSKQYQRYFNKALSLAQKYGSKQLLAVCHMDLTIKHMDNGQLDSANYHALVALRLGLSLKDPITIGNAYSILGHLATSAGNYELADDYFQKMLGVPNLPSLFYIRFTFYYGEFLNKAGKHHEAKKYLISSLQEARDNNAVRLERKILGQLILVYENLGDYQNAYLNSKSYYSILEEIQNIDLKKEVEALNVRYGTEKKEKEILKLEARNFQQQLSLIETSAKARQRFWWGLTTTLCLIILAAGFWIYFSVSQQRKKIAARETALQNEKLLQLKQSQKNIALQSMLKGEEIERSRVAKELHDGVGILLSSVKLSLNQLSGTKDHLLNTNKLLDNASSELRRIAQNMKPDTLTKYGLVTAIEDLCDEINFNRKLQIKFQQFHIEESRYNDIAFHVYRIIQELLNNVIKHAQATYALVQLIQREEQLLIVIEDNGIGFHPSRGKDKGQGIKNVESRVKYINGKLSWDSMLNKGTTVSISIDLNKQHDIGISH